MRLFGGCAVAVFAVMLDAILLDLHQAVALEASAVQNASPRFRDDGPNADDFGRKDGYPICARWAYINDTHCRVGAFSHHDTLFPARTIAAPTQPVPLARAPSEPIIRYRFNGLELTLDEYLNRQPVTGFLIAKDDTVLVERYQYGHTDTDRMASFSMAKSVVGLLIGIAVHDGAIHSVDDLAETYVPDLKDTEYGRTPIKALLQMASGVAFSEDDDNPKSDGNTLARLTLGQDPAGSLGALKQFNTRRSPPGARFYYASSETEVLGLVLAAATKRTLSDYAAERLWRPLGAEADATWIIDATGQEVAFGFINAVLRDWARLGLMLAHRGSWQGRSVVPEEWLAASARDAIPTDLPIQKYGYQIRYSADTKRFLLRGIRGQNVFVDPDLKLVLVQTAVGGGEPEALETLALWTALRALVH
ncbi:serine hydrolase [Bradyrhizobium jicamae]|uniref:serine hydrolase domain-containing protein n=1 Tax=Bradyrhizobium jicamae TaxID=280332 RepID=UPI001BAC0E4E|nr:serine hydrolase [Bradyrhizobium jicamae]MBR0939317.1 serine hydrolase [Bradyrhizobium jicamae]